MKIPGIMEEKEDQPEHAEPSNRLLQGFHVYHGANVIWWIAFLSGWIDPFSIFHNGEVFLLMLPLCGLFFIGGCWKVSFWKTRMYAFGTIAFWWLIYGYNLGLASAAV